VTISLSAAQATDVEYECWPLWGTPENTQIYEGTNQIQRVLMARQILKD
jgi:alkylation response protein AidB-like acyl-CoA dehydrogenase